MTSSFAKTTMALSSYSSPKGRPKTDKYRHFQLRILAVGGERCPVALFKQFVSRRLQNPNGAGPFYLSIRRNRKSNDNIKIFQHLHRANFFFLYLSVIIRFFSFNLEFICTCEFFKKLKLHSPKRLVNLYS